MPDKEIPVRVKQMRHEADTVLSVELVALDGSALPAYAPGAHIDIILENDLRRSYSLVTPYREGAPYLVAVHEDTASRGGSRYVHGVMRCGDKVRISHPRNNFPLDYTAEKSVFIAGGIGITPIMCMLHRLSETGREWTLHYAARRRSGAAFLDRLGALSDRGKVHLHFDDEARGALVDIAGVIAASPQAHFYCCGPEPMLAAFEAAARALPRNRVHLEYFSATEEVAREGGFDVVLHRSGRTLHIEPGKTILDVLIENKVSVPFSCSEGVCGTCETRVLEGRPDHRDMILSDEERAAGETMMVCCSGSKSPRLVLDL